MYVYYEGGSRRQEVITGEMGDFRGTLQSDAYRAYSTLRGRRVPGHHTLRLPPASQEEVPRRHGLGPGGDEDVRAAQPPLP